MDAHQGRSSSGRRRSLRSFLLWVPLTNLLFIVLAIWVFLFYYTVQDYCDSSKQHEGIKLSLTSPAYLSLGDAQDIQVTVLNERAESATITVTLSYLGTSMCQAGENGSHFITFSSLPSHGRATSQVRVHFPPCFSEFSFQNHPGDVAEFKVWLTVEDGPAQELGRFSLLVSPIPMSKKVAGALYAFWTALAVFWGKELWDWLKKRADPTAEEEGGTLSQSSTYIPE